MSNFRQYGQMEKQRWEESERRRAEERRSEKRKRKKMQVCEKVGKSRNTVFFQCFKAPDGRKVGSLKRRVRSHHEPSGQMRDEKLHAVVRSTFSSRNVQDAPTSEHFWKLRCRKSARGCGTNSFSKSKCTKHVSVGPLLEVEMSKKWTPL